MKLSFLASWSGLLLLGSIAAAADGVDYQRDIKPILSSRCYSCHGALRQKAGLRLDTAELIRKGGDSGPAIVPGKSGASLLIQAVLGKDGLSMPPKEEGAPLSAEQIAKLKTWIDQGAKAPKEAIPDDPRKHWAFRIPVRPEPPRVVHAGWVRNPIDAFVAAEHDRHRLQARPTASRETLLRRVHLDLIGLPPTREELHRALRDEGDNWYEKVVYQLLSSPHYGERWGRHWMDVWRYSDWYGRRRESDMRNSYSLVWRWRDWIVRSLNEDKGYDAMVRQMLAADELAPEDDAGIVATGFIVRNWFSLNYHQWMRDLVEHTGKAFLGLTFNCAHCHDHKYDPISQEEYFRFRAFFEPLELRQDRVPGEPDPGPFKKYNYASSTAPVKSGLIRVFDEKLDAKTHMYILGDERNRFDRPPVAPAAPAFLGGAGLAIAPVELPPAAWYPGSKPFIQQEETARCEKALAAARETLRQREQQMPLAKQQLEALKDLHDANRPPLEPRLADLRARAQAVVNGFGRDKARLAAAEAERESLRARIAADQAQGQRLFEELSRSASQAERTANLRLAEEKLLLAEQAVTAAKSGLLSAADDKAKQQAGAVAQKAEQQLAAAHKGLETARQALAAPSDKYTPLSPVYPRTSTGRRKALAEWLTRKDNPLVARVAVNHIWMRHFGKPLVETVFDFGRNGKKPSHPELLDWLAVEFMSPTQTGATPWSMKHIHRLIVTSNTYRMQSGAGPDSPNLAADADNRFLWQFPKRRLEAEVVRDCLLHAAGELDPTMGGPEVENPLETSSRRRSLYFSIHPEDGGHMKLLELFDAPDPCDCYRRTESLLPQQALALTNSRLALEQSRLLARKLSARVPADEVDESAFIVAAFEQVLSRRPSAAEDKLCRTFLLQQQELYRQAKPVTNPPAGGAVGPSPDPRVRARESLLRSLFNHGDFVTIR